MSQPLTPSLRIWRPIHALLFILLTVAVLFVPALRVWPLPMLVPLAAYLILVAVIRPLRASFGRWRFGEISGRAALATLVIAAGSCAVLATFHVFTHPDVHFLKGALPVALFGSLLPLGILFSVLNACLEEAIFRGIFFDAIEAHAGVLMAGLVTAVVFGYCHMNGYPPGALGAVLAGIYGLCLAWLRVFTRGLGWPIMAHIAADATIFTILAKDGAL
jgi:membrane protease YdiL (CAAX protease family)